MPGSYYVILMLQLIVLFPAVRKFYEWNTAKGRSWAAGLAWVFAFQCLYEAATYMTDLSIGVYRLLIFRYVIFPVCRYLLEAHVYHPYFCLSPVKKDDSIRRSVYPGSRLPKIGSRPSCSVIPPGTDHPPQRFFGRCRCLLMLYFAMNVYPKSWESAAIGRWLTKTLQLCGKASYHIYIVQMLWFGLAISHLNTASYRQLIVFFGVGGAGLLCGWVVVLYIRMQSIRNNAKI